MGENFCKFKKRAFVTRLAKSLLLGFGIGTAAAGTLLILSKLETIAIIPLLSALIGFGAALAAGACAFFIQKGSDYSIARKLDSELGLTERAQTMVAYRDNESEMLRLQREDTDSVLAGFHPKKLRMKRLSLYIAVLCIGIAVLAAGIIIKKPQDEPGPDTVNPFELSPLQIAGLGELIEYVDDSDMDEPYKSIISDELTALLDELTNADTEPEMQAALAKSLTVITTAAYDSSSMTEILNSLWATENAQIKALAKALDTSGWVSADDEANWGDFAQKYEDFSALFDFESLSESDEPSDSELKLQAMWALEDFVIKAESALGASDISDSDILYAAVVKLLGAEDESLGANVFSGFRTIYETGGEKTYEQIYAQTGNTLECMTQEFYNVICMQKTNTDVGEYVLKKLALMFSVVIPEFERPTLKESTQSGENNDEENEGSGGGVGSGPTFGSDDLVLDPVTGKYVTYGTLYATYNSIMIEKVNSNRYAYTDEQIKAIEKYFALLYSGLKKD